MSVVSASYTPSTAAAFGFFNTAGYRGGGIKIPRGDRSEHRAGKKRGGRAVNEEHRAGTDGNTDTVAPPTARGWYIGTGAER